MLFILYCRYGKTETACFRNCAEKLHLVGGELPLLFVLVPWLHNEEIITKCNSMDEELFYVGKIIKQGLLCSVWRYVKYLWTNSVYWTKSMSATKKMDYYWAISLKKSSCSSGLQLSSKTNAIVCQIDKCDIEQIRFWISSIGLGCHLSTITKSFF